MTYAVLYDDNTLSLDLRNVGKLMAVTRKGQVQKASGASAQVAALFLPRADDMTLVDPIPFDMPVCVSTSPSEHKLNPELITAIMAWLAFTE